MAFVYFVLFYLLYSTIDKYTEKTIYYAPLCFAKFVQVVFKLTQFQYLFNLNENSIGKELSIIFTRHLNVVDNKNTRRTSKYS